MNWACFWFWVAGFTLGVITGRLWIMFKYAQVINNMHYIVNILTKKCIEAGILKEGEII